ncbi:SPOR domain-containing protein [Flavobacterium sp.]|uniref:SPOR domain-containing protein n=1 Tax=Flavobacterium sp. TaxID=239 RepID=UPI0035297B68
MLFTQIKKFVYSLFLLVLLFINYELKAQSVTIEQDAKFEHLLNEKRKANASLTVNDRWKIQIFTGNNENSKKELISFKREYKDFDATIVFHTPVYKVWVGNYKTRIEAERNLKELKEKYPNAFLIKPNK